MNTRGLRGRVTCGSAAVAGRHEVDHSSRADDEPRRGRVDGQRVRTLGVCVDLVLHRHLTHNHINKHIMTQESVGE